MVFAIFPGAEGHGQLYEDEGSGLDYQRGACAWTGVEHRLEGRRRVVRVGPRMGHYRGMPSRRDVEVRVIGAVPPAQVLCDGRPLPWLDGDARDAAERGASQEGWFVEGDTLTTRVVVPGVNPDAAQEVIIETPAEADGVRVDGFAGGLAAVLRAMRIVKQTWPRGAAPARLIELAQTGRRITLWPDRATAELDAFWRGLPEVPADLRTLQIPEAEFLRALAQVDSRL
jgi:hypothetical protein